MKTENRVGGKREEPTAGGIDLRFEPIVTAFARKRDVLQERSFGTENVLSVKGKMFAMLVRGKFVAKLPKARVDELLARGIGVNFEPSHGRRMKEWIVEEGKTSWVDLAKEAYDFVKGANR